MKGKQTANTAERNDSMKTIEALMEEVKSSDALQNEFANISDTDSLAAFLKNNGCDASAEEFAAYMQSVYAAISDDQQEGELSDEDAEAISGGMGIIDTTKLMSLLFKKTSGGIVSMPNFSKRTIGFFIDLVFRAGITGPPVMMQLSESPEVYPQDNNSVIQV